MVDFALSLSRISLRSAFPHTSVSFHFHDQFIRYTIKFAGNSVWSNCNIVFPCKKYSEVPVLMFSSLIAGIPRSSASNPSRKLYAELVHDGGDHPSAAAVLPEVEQPPTQPPLRL